jgi:hypothetical protein
VLNAIGVAHQRRTEMELKWRKMGSPQTRAQKEFVRNYIKASNATLNL